MNSKSALRLFSTLFVVALLSVLLIGCTGETGPGAEPEGGDENGAETGGVLDKQYNPKLASAEVDGDFMTVWAENYADHMREWSDGMYDVEVFGYGTLGSSRDIVEQAQIGIVEYVYSDHGWLSGFVPEAQILALNYMWPQEKTAEVIDWVVRNGEFMGIFEECCRANGFVPLSLIYEGWQTVTSNKPVNTLDLFNGFKIRVMANALLVETYAAYGGVPTPMSYGEVYGGLQMGQIEGQVNPIFAIRSMNFFEVQDYMTQLWSEPFIGVPCVNMQYYDALPEAVQQEMRKFWVDAIIPSAEYIDSRHEDDLAAMLEQRPEITVTELTAEETIPFKERALTVYDKYLEVGGDNAQRCLDALQKDIADAKAALGVE